MKENPNYYAIIPADVRYDKKLKDKAKLLYGEITALTNEYGYCYASNKYFANLYKVSTTTISLLIKNLIDCGYLESEILYKENSKEIDKRYLRIFKGGYLRKIKGGIKENLKENNTSINNTSINNINKKEINKERNEAFEQLWKLYPNKKGKKNAYKSFIKAIENGVSVEKIYEGINNYIKYIEIEHIELKYVKNGSTWFNQECWNDEYIITRKPTTKDLKIDISDF